MPLDGASFLYETLLPFLNCRALLANVDPNETDWEALPVGGPGLAPSHVATEATRFVMRGSAGLSKAHASQLLLVLRWTVLRMAEAELRHIDKVSASDAALLHTSCRHLATLVSDLEPRLPPKVLAAMLSTFSAITARLDGLASAASPAKPLGLALPGSATVAGGAAFPFVGRLRADVGVDHLVGESRPSPIVLPCELSRVPSAVSSYDEVADALRHCLDVCGLLGNQQHLLRNSVHLPCSRALARDLP